MPRMRMSLLPAVMLLGIALWGGCGEEETVFVTPEPMIKVALTATPTTLDTGAKVSVEVEVTTARPGPFTYAWQATGGSFANAAAESTGWTAPDDPDLYTLSVTVRDGEEVGSGKIDVAVGQYLPADSPYYRGAVACATCHSGGNGGDEYSSWSETAHAGALGALAAFGSENSSCLACHTVGSNGLNANAALNNGGYDETAVARLAGVQCENCHGPGSAHTGATGLPVEMAAGLCGQCHEGTHHPTYSEWQSSGHAGIEEEAAGRASCAKCHNGLLADTYLDDPAGWSNPTSDPAESGPIACATCHDPHGSGNPGDLRNGSISDPVLPNSILTEASGAGRLCMHCHNGRRAESQVESQIQDGTEHFGPHHSLQGDMLAGVNAYEKVNETFPWSSSKHILVEDACVTCHTHAHAGDPEHGIPNFTGHNFEPTVEACAPCHGTLADFSEIMAKQDFDDDGTIEGVQVEIEGLLVKLEEAIIDASTTAEARAILETSFEDSLGSPRVTTVDQRKAGYNWAFVSFDGSMGVHNTTYAVQLLQQSIELVSPGALSPSAIIRDAN